MSVPGGVRRSKDFSDSGRNLLGVGGVTSTLYVTVGSSGTSRAHAWPHAPVCASSVPTALCFHVRTLNSASNGQRTERKRSMANDVPTRLKNPKHRGHIFSEGHDVPISMLRTRFRGGGTPVYVAPAAAKRRELTLQIDY